MRPNRVTPVRTAARPRQLRNVWLKMGFPPRSDSLIFDGGARHSCTGLPQTPETTGTSEESLIQEELFRTWEMKFPVGAGLQHANFAPLQAGIRLLKAKTEGTSSDVVRPPQSDRGVEASVRAPEEREVAAC